MIKIKQSSEEINSNGGFSNRKMQEKGLDKEYTMEKLLLELESIQSICEPGRAPIVCEVLEKQRKIYEALEVIPPQ